MSHNNRQASNISSNIPHNMYNTLQRVKHESKDKFVHAIKKVNTSKLLNNKSLRRDSSLKLNIEALRRLLNKNSSSLPNISIVEFSLLPNNRKIRRNSLKFNNNSIRTNRKEHRTNQVSFNNNFCYLLQ
jgi:hypothetical protein